MTNLTNHKFDLEERTAKFGEKAILLAKKLPKNTVTNPLINQFIKSSTSMGANYSEADDAESRLDFKHKIGICKKESRETKHWLRMFKTACPEFNTDVDELLQEAKELNLIFNAINNKLRK